MTSTSKDIPTRKILVFGNSGSGKSTFAKHLANTEGLAHFDLDTIAWLDTQPPARAPIDAAQLNLDRFIAQHSSWVIEGCYADLIDLVVPRANELIFLNLSIEQCIENAKRRPWEPHKYPSKVAQDNNLPMLLDWIAGYTDRSDELSYQAHKRIFESFKGNKRMLTENVAMS
jgi:adenylate kinase family enzyme